MAVGKRDYYEILGVSENADPREIRDAYRARAKRYHPDTSAPGSAPAEERDEEFIRVREAYDTLADADKRGSYDSSFVSRAAGTGACPDEPLWGTWRGADPSRHDPPAWTDPYAGGGRKRRTADPFRFSEGLKPDVSLFGAFAGLGGLTGLFRFGRGVSASPGLAVDIDVSASEAERGCVAELSVPVRGAGAVDLRFALPPDMYDGMRLQAVTPEPVSLELELFIHVRPDPAPSSSGGYA